MADYPQPPAIFPSTWHRRQHEARAERSARLAPELRVRQLSDNALWFNLRRCARELTLLSDEIERRRSV